MKIQLEQLDLLEPWPAMAMRDGYYAVRVLVRAGSIPIGDVFLRPVRGRVVTPERLRRRIARKYGERIGKLLGGAGNVDSNELLSATGAPETVRAAFNESHGRQSWPMPRVTVAVSTQGRVDLLGACLCNLQQLDYADVEILVVDNGNDPVPTRELAEKLGVEYMRCRTSAPGRARNAAVERARSEWVAFIDDDCRPERDWLKQLVRPAAENPGCRCVCGMVQPARLECSADIAFEMHRGLAQRFDDITLTRDHLTASSTHPAPVWHLGSASNLLVHKQFVQLAGGFDAHLPCGEHADLFYRALLDDYTVHYMPRATVHHHRTWTRKSLRQHIETAAGARAAFHVQRIGRHGDHRSLLELIWHRPKALTRELVRALNGKSKYPWSLLLVELRGTLVGPGQYGMAKVLRFWKSQSRKSQASRRPTRGQNDAKVAVNASQSRLPYDLPPGSPTRGAA